MPSCTSKTKWGMVVVGSGFIRVGSLAQKELGGAIMSGPNSFHQGGSTPFGFVFEVGVPFKQKVRYIRMAPFTSKR